MKTALTWNGAATVVAWVAYAFGAALAITGGWSKRRAWQVAAIVATAIGFAAHVVAQVAIVVALHRAPWGSLYEFVSTMALGIVAVTLFWLLPKRQLSAVAGFVLGAAVLLTLVAAYGVYTPPAPLQAPLRSNWLVFHVLLAIVGSCLLLTGGVVSALYLLRLRWEERNPTWASSREGSTPTKVLAAVGAGAGADEVAATSLRAEQTGSADAVAAQPGPRTDPDNDGTATRGGLLAHLPSADRLDDVAKKVLTLAFPIWTLAIFAGAVWGEQAWGRPWGWDPKETTSFIIWGLFAAYLHARATRGWKGRAAAWLGVVGALAVLFNSFVVNLFISGLHSYAG